jgi:hypothetical protein
MRLIRVSALAIAALVIEGLAPMPSAAADEKPRKKTAANKQEKEKPPEPPADKKRDPRMTDLKKKGIDTK